MRPQEILSDCLVDADDAAHHRAGLRRHASLLLSVGLQSVLVAGALVAPLLASEALRAKWREPVPPWRVMPIQNAPPRDAASPRPPAGNRRGPAFDLTRYQPPQVPTGVHIIRDELPTTPDNMSSSVPCPGCPINPEGVLPPILGLDSRGPLPPMPPAAERKPPLQRIVRGEGVQRALLVRRVEPRYPPLARSARIQGTVELRAIIARDGSIQSLEALSGHPLLVPAAMEAIQQWRYQPTLLNGQPVEVETRISVIFTLDR